MIQIASYLRFELDTTPVKRNGEMVQRATPKYNLVSVAGYWGGLDKLKTAKNEVYLYKVSRDSNPNLSMDAPEYSLQVRPKGVGKINLTGLRLEMLEDSETTFASGEPLQRANYKNLPNPLFEFKMDGFLFIIPKGWEYFEMLVLEGQQPMIDAHRRRLALGAYDEQLKAVRASANSYIA